MTNKHVDSSTPFRTDFTFRLQKYLFLFEDGVSNHLLLQARFFHHKVGTVRFAAHLTLSNDRPRTNSTRCSSYVQFSSRTLCATAIVGTLHRHVEIHFQLDLSLPLCTDREGKMQCGSYGPPNIHRT